MARRTTIYVDTNPARLGENATREDLQRYAEKLGKKLSGEFGVEIRVRDGEYGVPTICPNPEIEARIRAIESGDEWIALVGTLSGPSASVVDLSIGAFSGIAERIGLRAHVVITVSARDAVVAAHAAHELSQQHVRGLLQMLADAVFCSPNEPNLLFNAIARPRLALRAVAADGRVTISLPDEIVS